MPSSYPNSSLNNGDAVKLVGDRLRRWLETAFGVLDVTAAKSAMRGRDIDEAKSEASPTLSGEVRAATVMYPPIDEILWKRNSLRHQAIDADEAKLHLERAHQELRESFGLSEGLADPSVMVMDIGGPGTEYLEAALKVINRHSVAQSPAAYANAETIMSRLWVLRSRGWTPAEGESHFNVITPPAPSVVVLPHNRKIRGEDDGIIGNARRAAPMFLVVVGKIPPRGFPTADMLLWTSCDRVAEFAKAYVDATTGISPLPVWSLSRTVRIMPPDEYRQTHQLAKKERRNDGVWASILTPEDYAMLFAYRENVMEYQKVALCGYVGGENKGDPSLALYPLYPPLAAELLRAAGRGVAVLDMPDSWIEAPELAGLRQYMTHTADALWLDATDQGLSTVTATWIQGSHRQDVRESPAVFYRKWLMKTTPPGWPPFIPKAFGYIQAQPTRLNRHSFLPALVSAEYRNWISLDRIGDGSPINGLMENRRNSLIDMDRDALAARMRIYCCPGSLDESTVGSDTANALRGLLERQSRFDPETTRRRIIQEGFRDDRLRPYDFKPFDRRYCYYSTERALWSEARPRLAEMWEEDEEFVIVRMTPSSGTDGIPFFWSRHLGDNNLMRGHAYYFPIGVSRTARNAWAPEMRNLLGSLGIPDKSDVDLAWRIWRHVLAIGYAPAYLAENAAGLQYGWPRIPFPVPTGDSEAERQAARELLADSAALGEQVARLLDPDNEVEGVTRIPLRRELAEIAVLRGAFAASVRRGLTMTEPWGKRGGARRNQPNELGHILSGSGRLDMRPYTVRERRELEAGALAQALPAGTAYAVSGHETADVYLNNDVCWTNIPSNVWNFVIGGHAVLRKWLGYRCVDIFGRSLTPEEADDFTRIARRLAALRLLEPALNRNYSLIRETAIAQAREQTG